MPTIFDNIDCPFLENSKGNGLKDALKLAYRGDFCVGYFNLRGWRHIDGVVEKWPSGEAQPPCRLLVGMQRLPQEDLPALFSSGNDHDQLGNQALTNLRRRAASEFRKQLTIGIPNATDEAGLRRLCRQLKEERLVVKLFLEHPLHAKLYLAHRKDNFTPVIGYLGSSNLTMSGLRGQGELNIDVLEQDAAGKLVQWFEDRWESDYCLDITSDLIHVLEESWASERLIPPFHIYLKIAWHLSRDARDGIKEFRIPHAVAHNLMPFQEKAVQIACRHLNKQGGVLVGDVVGLGKTRIAATIARIMGDDQMLETLILCPKNLVPMWEAYAHEFGLRAPKVISQSMAQRELPDLLRYRLVIIDESHNFRNREGKIYQTIRDYVQRNESKVVLLSATPYNKTYLDLANQLRIFRNEQDDLGIRPEALLREIGESEFSLANPNTPLTSLAAFEASHHADDWRQVMRLFMVRRTRSFILANYAETDERDGRKFLTMPDGERFYFPDRKPHSIRFRSNPEDPEDPCARLMRQKILTVVDGLDLPRYGMSLYLRDRLPEDLSKDEGKILEDLSRAGKRLKGFCRTNLFKRLESSAHAFLLSVHRHILRNEIFVHALREGLSLPIGQQDASLLDTRLNDNEEKEDELFNNDDSLPPLHQWTVNDYEKEGARLYRFVADQRAERFRWVRPDVFKKTLLAELQRDARALHGIITETGEIDPLKDYKFQALLNLLHRDHPDEKFILFSQFADTIDYLHASLLKSGLSSVDKATGDSENPTEQAWRFSPESNEKLNRYPRHKQTRVLLATDVLSEGQNLQDAARVINYDLPWAIIRLIQRAGRVDRIGQKADTIDCYSFLPADGVEEIIKLRRRLTERLRQNEEVVGSDESFFESQSTADESALQNLYNEKSGILDEPEDDEVDLTSEAFEIWNQAVAKNPELRKAVESLPDVVFSTKTHQPDPEHPAFTPPGVLSYIRTSQDTDALLWIDQDGKPVSESPVRILRAAACDPESPALPRREDHHELVAVATKIVQEERHQTHSGKLGNRRSARYRVYERLQDFLRRRQDDLLLTDEIRRSIQALFDHPLTTEAVDKLNRQLRSGIDDDSLAELVTTLHRDERLIVPQTADTHLKQPRILCSLGLIDP